MPLQDVGYAPVRARCGLVVRVVGGFTLLRTGFGVQCPLQHGACTFKLAGPCAFPPANHRAPNLLTLATHSRGSNVSVNPGFHFQSDKHSSRALSPCCSPSRKSSARLLAPVPDDQALSYTSTDAHICKNIPRPSSSRRLRSIHTSPPQCPTNSPGTLSPRILGIYDHDLMPNFSPSLFWALLTFLSSIAIVNSDKVPHYPSVEKIYGWLT
jgi:hypothetical protein